MKPARILVAVSAVVLLGAGLSAQRGATPAFEPRYHTYAESTALLKDLASRYPRLARLSSIGKSATGLRELWCLEIANEQTGPSAEKPAVYFDGNQHASEVTGGEVTLHMAHHLLTRYGQDPEVTRLVDTRVVYIVQRADPDGAEAYMTGRVDWDPAKVPGARDADGDGRFGEDGPEDIDGDGEILRMRIPDPAGDWKPFKADPRLLVRRESGDREGSFYRVMDEGIDNDGDGRVNEDPPVAQFTSNRNYPAFWSSIDGRFRGSGARPLDEPNAALLVDFIIAHPNIAEVESFHTTSGIHLRPYAARPDSDFPPQDLQDYSALLAKGTEITGYPVASIYNDFTEIRPDLPPDQQPGVRRGVFVDWAYVHRGLFALTTELWTLEPFLNEAGTWGDIPRDKPLFAIPGRYNRPDVQAGVLAWLDRFGPSRQLAGQGFVAWKPFTHLTLGQVEIGGFTRYFLRNPPPGPFLQKILVDQTAFAIVHTLATPLVKVREVKVEPLAAGSAAAPAWRVTATLVNEGYLDTATEQARLANLARPVDVALELPSGGKVRASAGTRIPFLRGTRGSSAESLYTATWEVEVPAGGRAVVTIRSEKGGTARRETVLLR